MFWFKTEAKLALDAAVRAAAKPATELIVGESLPESHTFPPTSTHFGGNPYFEPGDEWPTLIESGRPYDFVCQVNLNDCPERPQVPFDLFTVFISWAMCEEGEIERMCIVRPHQEAAAAKAIQVPRPAPHARDDYRVRPCAVRTERFLTYPQWLDFGESRSRFNRVPQYPEIVAAALKFRDPNAAFDGSLKRIGCNSDFRSRIGGYPTWVHDYTLDAEDTVFLAQIAFERNANNCIGDAAPIYITASPTDPTRIDIDATQSF